MTIAKARAHAITWQPTRPLAVAGRHHEARVRIAVHPPAQEDQLVRVAHRQAAQHDGVDEAEDRRARADAEGQDEHDDGGEGRAPAELARRESQVSDQVVGERHAARIAALLLDGLDAAELAQRCTAGRLGFHARGDVLLDQSLDVEPDLLVELAVERGLAEERTDAEAELCGPAHGACSYPGTLFRTSAIAADRRSQVACSRSRYFRPARVSE